MYSTLLKLTSHSYTALPPILIVSILSSLVSTAFPYFIFTTTSTITSLIHFHSSFFVHFHTDYHFPLLWVQLLCYCTFGGSSRHSFHPSTVFATTSSSINCLPFLSLILFSAFSSFHILFVCFQNNFIFSIKHFTFFVQILNTLGFWGTYADVFSVIYQYFFFF